jgi:drug/metabolite transporter (DMT)-like permease
MKPKQSERHPGNLARSHENELPSRLAAASLAAAGSLWGTGFFFGKIAFREMSVTENVAFRFVFGSMVLLPFLLKNWKPFRGQELGMLLLAGIVGVPVQFLLQFKGLQLTTVSHASLIVATLPMLLALGSAAYLRERLAGMEWATLLLSALGRGSHCPIQSTLGKRTTGHDARRPARTHFIIGCGGDDSFY